MKPVYQKLTGPPDEGFTLKVIRGYSFNCPWHFHSECELILVEQSGGYRMLGDHLATLVPGDLVLIGRNLPHIYQNDESQSGKRSPIKALLVQFEETFLGEPLLALSALKPTRRLLQRARLGLEVTGKTRDRVAEMMRQLTRMTGLARIIHFLAILDELVNSPDCRSLASPGFTGELNLFDQERMNRVCQFINDHLDRQISLPELARIVHFSPGAFSRFFRAHTGKTFPAFVNELRIGRACRLLTEEDQNITEIAFACGFGNLSNFNGQFHRLKGMTPREYRAQLQSE